MLETERAFFNANQDSWRNLYPGKIALVKDQELIGTFATQDEALSEGVRRYGLGSFLVRSVEHTERIVNIPVLALGLLNANSTCSD